MADAPHPPGTPPPVQSEPIWSHRWVTKLKHPERHGTLCRVIPGVFKGASGETFGYGSWGHKYVVEFEDGTQVVAPRAYIRRRGVVKPGGDQYGKWRKSRGD